MAKDVITRFKLETTAYDSQLKNAAKGLSDFAKTATNAGSEFGKFTQKNVEAAKSLGTMATSSTNATAKTKELVGAYNDLARTYNLLTKEQQQSDFGKAMAESLEKLQQRIRETKQEMQGLGDATGKMGSGGGGLNSLIGGISGKLGISPQMFTGLGAGIAAFGALKEAIGGNIETAKGFEKSMSQLSSLTGMVGSDLEKLKGYAIELGSSTTLSASQVADAFKMIGSQQPQLLSSGEALKAVTKNAITLAEAAGIELSDAAKTLSVSINQMGGDSNNAERYINVLAAAAQKGAGDIVWLGEAITKSGTTAKAVGTDYEELVANLEQLAKAGYDASTAGTALRSIIMNLEKQANQQYKPSVVGLTEAFKNLGEANLTLTEYQGIAGKMFAAQAKALADAAAEAKNMKEEITGTNIAEEQAKTNTDNLDGALKSLASAWEGLNLHINDSNGFLRTCVDWLKDVVVWADQAFTAAGRAQKKLLEMQGGTGGSSSPTKVDKQISMLGNGQSPKAEQTYNKQVENYNRYINERRNYFIKLQQWLNSQDEGVRQEVLNMQKKFGTANKTEIQDQMNAAISMLNEYKTRSEQILHPKTTTTGTTDPTGGGGSGSGSNKTKTTKADKEAEQTARMLAELRKQEAKATKEIADARAREHRTETTGTSGFNEQNIANWTAMMKDQLSKADFGSVVYNNIEENMRDMTTITDLTKEALKRGLNPESLGLTDMFETAFDGIDVPDQAIQGIIDKINAMFKDNPIKIDVKTGKVETGNIAKDGKEVAKNWQGAASAISYVGSAMSQIEDPAAKVMGTIAQAIATIALTYAKSLEGTFTPWDWIAGAAAGLAQMTAVISAIHSSTGYAEGGMIKGNSYSGDNLMAQGPNGQLIGLNAGEIVLNRAQAGVIAGALQGGGQTVRVVGKLSGESIFICAENWAKRTGKGEFVTWR